MVVGGLCGRGGLAVSDWVVREVEDWGGGGLAVGDWMVVWQSGRGWGGLAVGG